MPGRPLPPDTRGLVDAQRGVLSRGQALASGLTDAVVRAHLRAGRWQRALPGVYATFTGPLPWAARCWAALLYAGDGAVLSHDTAAALHGLAEPALPVHVTVPARRRVRRQTGLVAVHHSERLEAARQPARTPPRTRQRRVRREGRTSWTDVAYERYRVAVELDGRRGHESAGDVWRDLDRDNALALRGEVTLRFGWRDVLGRPCAVAAQVGQALQQGGWTGSPRRCGAGCGLS